MRYIPLLLLLFACNNADNKEPQSGTHDQNNSSNSEKKNESSSADNCASFFWFRKGTIATFKETDASGKSQGATTMTVTDVHNDGNAVVAEMIIKSAGQKELKGQYKCDGGKVMMNLGSMFKNNTMNGMSMELSNEGWLEFPLDLKTGDNLQGTPYEMKAVKDGKTFMTMKSEVVSRIVGNKEKISTPAGRWDGFAVAETRTMTMDMPAMQGQQTMPSQKMQFTYWFVPRFGVVKTEIADATGKLQHRSELESIK